MRTRRSGSRTACTSGVGSWPRSTSSALPISPRISAAAIAAPMHRSPRANFNTSAASAAPKRATSFAAGVANVDPLIQPAQANGLLQNRGQKERLRLAALRRNSEGVLRQSGGEDAASVVNGHCPRRAILVRRVPEPDRRPTVQLAADRDPPPEIVVGLFKQRPQRFLPAGRVAEHPPQRRFRRGANARIAAGRRGGGEHEIRCLRDAQRGKDIQGARTLNSGPAPARIPNIGPAASGPISDQGRRNGVVFRFAAGIGQHADQRLDAGDSRVPKPGDCCAAGLRRTIAKIPDQLGQPLRILNRLCVGRQDRAGQLTAPRDSTPGLSRSRETSSGGTAAPGRPVERPWDWRRGLFAGVFRPTRVAVDRRGSSRRGRIRQECWACSPRSPARRGFPLRPVRRPAPPGLPPPWPLLPSPARPFSPRPVPRPALPRPTSPRRQRRSTATQASFAAVSW